MCQQKTPVLGSGHTEQAKSSGRSPPVAPLPAGQATTGSADASFFHSLRSLQNGFAAFRILNAKLQGLVSKEFQQLNILCFIRLRKTIAINTEILRFAKSIALYLRNFLFRYFWNTQNQQEPCGLHLRQQKKANLLYLRH